MKEHQVFSSVIQAMFPAFKGSSVFVDTKEGALALTAQGYHALPSPSHKKVLYVDGGQGVLLCSAAQLIGLVRVAAVCYSPQREFHERATFVVSVLYDGKEEVFKISFSALDSSFTPTPLQDVSLYAREFCEHGKRVQPLRLLGLARRYLEFKFAAFHAEKVSAIILDGSLDAFNDVEKHSLQHLQEVCSKHHVLLGGVSKTTQTLTSAGTPLAYELMRMQPSPQWWYGPIGEFSLAKLSSQSAYCFRVDGDDVPSLLSALLPVCNDPVFLGYPYGLIEADNLARVTEQETAQARVLLQMLLSKQGIDLTALESSVSAHGILDSIRF